jgi:hypothetical protein
VMPYDPSVRASISLNLARWISTFVCCPDSLVKLLKMLKLWYVICFCCFRPKCHFQVSC